MPAQRAYLDYNASAPLLDEARAAMMSALERPGNASSVHSEGRAKRALLDTARQHVAALCNAKPDNVIFTSGATEAATALLTAMYRMGRAPLTIASLHALTTDHPCILSGGRFDAESVNQVPVGADGVADTGALDEALQAGSKDDGLPMVACHLANNESGVIQPIADIAALTKSVGGLLVVDAVQGAGRLEIDIEALGADFLILSSHKMGGPQGAGAIVAASDLVMPQALIRGGGQEKGHRAGTENVAAIAGFGEAARLARAALADVDSIGHLRDRFEATIHKHIPDVVIYAADARRLANTSLFSIPGFKTETAQIAFDLAGVAISAGSACSSGRVGESHVLAAMGFGEHGNALRLSIGRETAEMELEMFDRALGEIAARRSGSNQAA